MKHDIVVRGAIIIDVTGSPCFAGDVAIDADKIAAVGDLSAASAARDIDVGGRVVAPGFIDAHTHDDSALLAVDGMVPKISQGVTTVIAGNCGLSLAPLRFSDAPPPPFSLLGGQENFRFDLFAHYVEELHGLGTATNSALLVGHTTLRWRVMPSVDRAANEIALMQAQVELAMAAGAFGLSTGLDYPPAIASSTAEVKALAQTAARLGGHYVTHTRNYFDKMAEALEEAIDIATHAQAKLVISHHQLTGRKNFGKSGATLERIDAARQHIDIALDVYPYAASSTVLRLDRCDKGLRILITCSDSHPEMVNRQLSDSARDWNCSERQAAERLLPAGAVYFQLDEADVRCILAHPRSMIGSDGLPHDKHPHPRLWGTFPRVLGHYARDVGLFTLEEAVFRMTGLTAKEFGIDRRGRLIEGHFADVVVFDSGTVTDRATFEHPQQTSVGIDLVVVNGVAVWQNGRPTGDRPGSVLRPLAADQRAS
jgi:N-acyl-D-amino-acid deacylase